MTIDTSNWMDLVADSKKLNELSIPGTHDSGAKDPDADGLEKIRLTTQDRTIFQQLLDGIRFLDIRVKYTGNQFLVYHEDVSLNLTFSQVLGDCLSFLLANRRETIIMSIKEESAAENNDAGVTFQARFKTYCDANPGLWYLASGIPTLGEVRGKIVLFRRFPLDTTTPADRASTTIASEEVGGIAAEPFEDDQTFVIAGPPRLKIQDEYETLVSGELGKKYDRVKALLDEASGPVPAGTPETLFVNFGSAAGGSLHTRPKNTAAFINPKLSDYFGEAAHERGRFGIVVTDFETAALNTLIIRTNLPLFGGYWIVSEDGQVDALGTASDFPVFGTAATEAVAIAARRDGTGYFLLARNGSVYTYGTARKPPPEQLSDAKNAGKFPPAGTVTLSMAVKPTTTAPTGFGYWILAVNGNVGGYHANYHGQIEGGTNLQAVSIVATPDARGYWILASNGRIHNYGSAGHFGDRRDDGKTAVGMAATPSGNGYWILTSNGAVRHFGDAGHYDSGVGDETARAIAATREGTGYWILSTNGNIHAYGNARYLGRSRHATAVGIAADPRLLKIGA